MRISHLLFLVACLLACQILMAQEYVPHNAYGFRAGDRTNQLTTDGTKVLVTGFYKRANLYDVSTGRLLQDYDTHEFAELSTDMQYVISRAKEHLIKMFQTETGEEIFRVELAIGEVIISYALDVKNKRLAYTHRKKSELKMSLINFETGELLKTWSLPCNPNENQLAFSPDGKWLVHSLSQCKQLILYDCNSYQEWQLNQEDSDLYLEKFTIDRQSQNLYTILKAGPKAIYLTTYDLSSKKRISKKQIEPNFGGEISMISMDEKEEELWVLVHHAVLHRIDIESAKVIEFYQCSRLQCGSEIINRKGGDYLINGREIIAYTAEKSPAHQLVESGDYLQGIAFSPDGRFIMSGSYRGVGRVVDLETGEVSRFSYRGGEMTNMAMSRDAKYVGLCGISGNLLVYDYKSKGLKYQWKNLGVYTTKLQFSEDNKYVAVRSKGVYIYDLANGNLVYHNKIEGRPATYELMVNEGVETTDTSFLNFWINDYRNHMDEVEARSKNGYSLDYNCDESGLFLVGFGKKFSAIEHHNWKSKKPLITQVFPASEKPVKAAINKNYLLVIAEGTLNLMDPTTKAIKKQFQLPDISDSFFDYIALSPDSRFVLLGNHADNALLLFDIEKKAIAFSIHYYQDKLCRLPLNWVAINHQNEFAGSSHIAIATYLQKMKGLTPQDFNPTEENKDLLKVR